MTASRGEQEAQVFGGAGLPDFSLQELVDALPFGFALSDQHGTILQVNAAFASTLRIDARFLVGKPIVALAPERYARSMRSILIGLRGDGQAVHWEQELTPRNGAHLAVEMSAAPMRHDGHEVVLWVIRDIRDRVAIERRLRVLTGDLEASVLERTDDLETERARLTAIMGQMPAGLVIVDAEGAVVSVNDEALRILRVSSLETGHGWEGSTVGGTPYGPDDWPLLRSLARGEVVTGERAEVVAGDGSRVVLDISSAPVKDSAGRLLGAACIFSDATVRERRERVEREFVTNAAHELQSPLAALVSAVEVLIGGAKDTPERDLFLEHVRRESERLTRLLRSLLILSRAEMGDAPTVGVVPLRPMIDAIARDLTPAPGVSVSVECPEDLAAVANAQLLEQALLNVAQNAVKYTPSGRISIAAARRGDRAQITVSDTGSGIAAGERPRVFDRFYRGPEGQGSGLGLAIARSVVKALGGSIELESEVGVGTTVRLYLPYVTALVKT